MYLIPSSLFPIGLTAILVEVNKIRNPSLAVASTILHLYKCALFYTIFITAGLSIEKKKATKN